MKENRYFCIINSITYVMMESFYIQNFKNFEELTLNQLRRVNLFVGKNSVGKSTLLEAIAIYLSDGDENCLKEILAGRGEPVFYGKQNEDILDVIKERFLSLFRGWEENYSKFFCIKLGEKKEYPLTIQQVYISDFRKNGMEGIQTLYIYNQEDIDENGGKLPITTNGLVATKADGDTSLIRYDNIRPFTIKTYKRIPYQMVHTVDFDGTDNAALYDKISLSPLENFIVKALNIINENIDRITFVNEGGSDRFRIPVVSLKDTGRRVHLSSMGDGLNRVLTIILSLLNCKNGVLLLDEFETGLHYSVQKQLWDIIFLLAEELNVQVFVTSHSFDCLKAFAEANVSEQGMLIRLEQRSSGIEPVCYTENKDIMFAAENDIELR